MGRPPVWRGRGSRLPAGRGVSGLGHGDRAGQTGQLRDTKWQTAALPQIYQVEREQPGLSTLVIMTS